MVDPATATKTTIEVGNLFAILRDGAFAFGILVFGWKARDFFQPIFSFFSRATKHMDTVEGTLTRMDSGMTELLTNHVRHMEYDLRTLSGRKSNHIDDMVE